MEGLHFLCFFFLIILLILSILLVTGAFSVVWGFQARNRRFSLLFCMSHISVQRFCSYNKLPEKRYLRKVPPPFFCGFWFWGVSLANLMHVCVGDSPYSEVQNQAFKSRLLICGGPAWSKEIYSGETFRGDGHPCLLSPTMSIQRYRIRKDSHSQLRRGC